MGRVSKAKRRLTLVKAGKGAGFLEVMKLYFTIGLSWNHSALGSCYFLANPVGKRAQLSPSLILGCNGHYLQDRRHYLLPFSSAASAFHSEPEAMDRWKPHFMTTCKLPTSNRFYQFPLADHSCVLKPATWAHFSRKTKMFHGCFLLTPRPPPKKKKKRPLSICFFWAPHCNEADLW